MEKKKNQPHIFFSSDSLTADVQEIIPQKRQADNLYSDSVF